MDYKKVLEDQIEQLQVLQKENIDPSFNKLTERVTNAVVVAEQIRLMVVEAKITI